jgi:hypothetical protein
MNPSGAEMYGIDPQEWGDALEEAMLHGGADPADAVLAGIEARHQIQQPLPHRFDLVRLDEHGWPITGDPDAAA